jgi:hypothetical protein
LLEPRVANRFCCNILQRLRIPPKRSIYMNVKEGLTMPYASVSQRRQLPAIHGGAAFPLRIPMLSCVAG